MDWRSGPRVSQVLDVLAARLPSGLDEVGPAAWVLPLGDGEDGLVHARLEGEWLRLSTASLGVGAGIEALERNRQLGGFAKLALETVPPHLHARAELPVESAGAFVRVLDPTLAGFARIVGQAPLAAPSDGRCEDETDARTLQALCAAAGWTSDFRSEEQISVDLGVRHAAPRAIVARSPASESAHVSATFAPLSSPSGACRDAVARFLLRAAAEVHMVRPVAVIDDDTVAPGFEIRFDTSPTPTQLGHALAALHVAVRRTVREVAALGADETLAGAFLRFTSEERTDRPAPRTPSTTAASALAANA